MTSPVSGDLLSAASLLATVLSLLYSTWYGDINSARKSKIPLQPDDRASVIDVVRTARRSRAVPLLVAAVLLTAALAPTTLEVVQDTWHVWLTTPSHSHYDPVQACFVGVFVVTVVLTVLTASAVRSLSLLLRKLHSPLQGQPDQGPTSHRPS